MARSRIKGITVEIGGDTTKLQTALKGVNQSVKSTQSQLKDVQKLLKLDPGNTELLVQKQKLLANVISNTKEKLSVLKQAAEQANQSLANGKISQDQYDALQREIIETEAQQAQNGNPENCLVSGETEKASAMATACAGYLNIPALRPYPETLGTVAEAAYALGEDTRSGSTLWEAAITLLGMSALIAVEVTAFCMTGIAVGNVACLLLGEPVAWVSISEVIHECFDFFRIALAVNTGISSAGLLAACAAELTAGTGAQLTESEAMPVGELAEVLENEVEEDQEEGEEEEY